MNTTALIQGSAIGVSAETSTDALGEAIAALAARIHAATYELAVMLREFDRRSGWNTGFASCAHWLHWRTGINMNASREKVRVARALADLPLISAAMQRGAISYAKVRALTRAATRDSEERLLNLALAGTAMHVERFVGAWRRTSRAQAAQQADIRHLNRELALWVDADGMVVIRARLAPEVGAVVQRAIQAAIDRMFREMAGSPRGEALTDEMTSTQRRADALVRVAEAALDGDLGHSATADRYQVALHVDAPSVPAPGNQPPKWEKAAPAVVEIDRYVVDVSAEATIYLTGESGLASHLLLGSPYSACRWSCLGAVGRNPTIASNNWQRSSDLLRSPTCAHWGTMGKESYIVSAVAPAWGGPMRTATSFQQN